MQYMGSKAKLSKQILPIMLNARRVGQAWVEPFLGGANMLDKVDGLRIASDSNKYLVALWKELQRGRVMPTRITKEDYDYVRANKEEDLALTAFVGFLCSFGGKWFGGYAKCAKDVNYADRGSRVLSEQVLRLGGVPITHCSYEKLEIPPMSLIYCDPPYAGTTKYKDHFNHDSFWDWCRGKSEEGHTVFVSEYSAPADIKCVFETKVKTALNKNCQNIFRVEKLFRV